MSYCKKIINNVFVVVWLHGLLVAEHQRFRNSIARLEEVHPSKCGLNDKAKEWLNYWTS